MPILIEHVTGFVVTILLLVILGNGIVIALAITRRQRRERYFQRIDEIRQRYSPVVAAILAKKIEYDRGLAALKNISGLDRDIILEQICMERKPKAAEIPILRKVCEDLGLVRIWQQHLTGKFDVATLRQALSRRESLLQRVGKLSFLLRAKATDHLGTIRHQASCPLLVKALDDPHGDVKTAALRALGAIKDPETFPALAHQLEGVIVKTSGEVSLRAIKSALVSFPLKHAVELIPSLQHAHRRVRFLATDIIREMVEREASLEEDFVLDSKVFTPELGEIFLTQLCFDVNPDVRARTTPVVAYLADPRSTPVLLTLLDDPEWFVRLHAARSLAKRKYLPQAAEIGRHLTDPHWMVRQATARTLLVFGQVGVDQLSEHFLGSPDRYSREQIADEMQRAGLIPTILTQFGSEADRRYARVIEQLAQMGKTSYMVAVLVSISDRNLRKKFLENFGHNADPQIKAWVKHLATRETDEELRALAQASSVTAKA